MLTDMIGHASSGTWTLGATGGVQTVTAQAGGAHAEFTAVACDPVCQTLLPRFVREGVFYRTNLGGQATVITGGGQDYSPALSADGRRIAFMRWEDDGPTLHVMNTDGPNLVRRTANFHSPTSKRGQTPFG